MKTSDAAHIRIEKIVSLASFFKKITMYYATSVGNALSISYKSIYVCCV